MRSNKKTLLALLALFAAVTVFATLSGRGQGAQRARHGSAEDEVPVADYSPAAAASPKRQAKSARHHGAQHQGAVEEYPLGMVNNHWYRYLPALPVSQSDEILVGQINGAHAFVSDDKTTVYSEYDVSVVDVLKVSGREALAAGSSIVASREGGAIRFSSGRVRQLRVIGQGVPRVGAQYVLFLKGEPDGDDYVIVTGYELRGGQVFPLDSASIPEVGAGVKLPFDSYAGVEENIFFDRLRNAITAPAQAGPMGR